MVLRNNQVITENGKRALHCCKSVRAPDRPVNGDDALRVWVSRNPCPRYDVWVDSKIPGAGAEYLCLLLGLGRRGDQGVYHSARAGAPSSPAAARRSRTEPWSERGRLHRL